MTATQAPTPGPLSGDDVNRECKACGAFKAERDAACTFCGLASTAPVEASGSEREPGRVGKFFKNARIAREVTDEENQPPRPQPSGETREAVARIIDGGLIHYGADGVHIEDLDGNRLPEKYDGMEEASKALAKLRTDAILALLSARPLALGGQQGEVSVRDMRLSHWAEVEPFPARAEAQDEGAAGEREAIARIIEPGAWSEPTMKSKGWEGRRAQYQARALDKADAILDIQRAHPSPTPAADAEALLPEVMSEEMERVWRGAFIHQGHRRHGRGAIGNSRRLKNPESCEQYAWRALRKHLLAALKSTAAKEGGE